MGKVKDDDKSKAKGGDKKEEEEKKDKEDEKEDEIEDPPVVKQLKEIDDKYLELEREYEREVQKLLVEYTKRQQPLLEERKKVLTAPVENGPQTGTPVLSGFWLRAMQNHPAFEDAIQEWDEPVLEFLMDIEKLQNEEDNNKGFTLTFHFLENPYFENSELTKEYATEETNPYCGEIEVKEIKCSEIKWKPGKNVTVEKIAKKVKGGGAKKQKQKGKEKEEPRPSFFRDFFRNLQPDMKLPEDAKEMARSLADEEDEDDDDEELCQYLMDNDHECGIAVRDNIIPFAVRWYTGEAAPDYDRMDEEDDEDEEEESEEDDEESEDDRPKGRGRPGGKAAAKKQGKPKGSPETKPQAGGDVQKEECKQQ